MTENTPQKKRLPDIRQSLRLPLSCLLLLLTGLLLAAASRLVGTQSIRLMAAWLLQKPLAALGTALFFALLSAVPAFFTRSLFAGGLLVSLIAMAASFVDYFKQLITSTPLLITDLGLIGKAGDIARLNTSSLGLSRNSVLAIAAVLIWLVLLAVISPRLRSEWKKSATAGGASLLVFALLFGVSGVAHAWLYSPLGVERGQIYSQALVNSRCGVPLGLWRSVLFLTTGSGFDEEQREEMTQAAASLIADIPAGGREETPNVIMVLSESFFDVTQLPGVQYEADPVADFHRVCESGVSGRFFTRTLGYGTCNIELELLSGINNRFLPSDEMLNYWDGERFEKLSTLPRIFAEEGYYTAFLHTFDDSIYNRRPIYERLGFSALFFSADFAEIDPQAAAAADYWEYMATKVSGDFYSDDYLAELLISLYEKEGGESPVFLYAASMENHTPYTAEKYGTYDFPFTSPLSEQAEGVLAAFTQGTAEASQSLGKLVDYFSQVEEPTIIVFFGDHRPGLPLESGTLYSALGMCPENSGDWTVEETALLYSTDYVIWANDESLLPGEAGERRDSGSAFLGYDTLVAAGAELDPYWRMIGAMRETYTAYTWSYFIDLDGAVSSSYEQLPQEEQRKLDVMTWLLREAVYATGEQPAFYDLE